MKLVPRRLIVLLIMDIWVVSAYGKGGDGGTPPPAEANLVVTTDPANGSTQNPV